MEGLVWVAAFRYPASTSMKIIIHQSTGKRNTPREIEQKRIQEKTRMLFQDYSWMRLKMERFLRRGVHISGAKPLHSLKSEFKTGLSALGRVSISILVHLTV